MATVEETTRSGQNICAMRYFGGVALDNALRELTWQAEKEPTMPNRVDLAPRWQFRLRCFPGGVDRPYGKKTNSRGTSERSAALGGRPRNFTRRYRPTQAGRKPWAGK